jgi:hypothetical protein
MDEDESGKTLPKKKRKNKLRLMQQGLKDLPLLLALAVLQGVGPGAGAALEEVVWRPAVGALEREMRREGKKDGSEMIMDGSKIGSMDGSQHPLSKIEWRKRY